MQDSRKRAALLEGFIHMGDTDNNNNNTNNNNNSNGNGIGREVGNINDDYNLNQNNANNIQDDINNDGTNSSDNNGNGNDDEQTVTVIKEFNIAKDYVEMDEDDPFGDPRHHVPAGEIQ